MKIVMIELLCADPRTQLELRNGAGLTALHCAVLHHGQIDDVTSSMIDNTEVIRILLTAGADPLATVRRSVGNLSHYKSARDL